MDTLPAISAWCARESNNRWSSGDGVLFRCLIAHSLGFICSIPFHKARSKRGGLSLRRLFLTRRHTFRLFRGGWRRCARACIDWCFLYTEHRLYFVWNPQHEWNFCLVKSRQRLMLRSFFLSSEPVTKRIGQALSSIFRELP